MFGQLVSITWAHLFTRMKKLLPRQRAKIIKEGKEKGENNPQTQIEKKEKNITTQSHSRVASVPGFL